MSDDLENTLRRWEGAVNEVEGAGNDSDEAVKELDDSRAALLVVLREALSLKAENNSLKSALAAAPKREAATDDYF